MQRTAHTTFTGKLGRKYQFKTFGAFPLSFCCQLLMIDKKAFFSSMMKQIIKNIQAVPHQ